MCEGGVLRKTLIPDGVDEESARRGRVDEVGALAFVTRLEIRESWHVWLQYRAVLKFLGSVLSRHRYAAMRLTCNESSS